MVLKIKKPTSAGTRHSIKIKKPKLIKKPLLKTKLIKKNSNQGKNYFGKITIKHKGGGAKQKYRLIYSINKNLTGIVYSLEYDPNRNTLIAAIFNLKQKVFFYILAPKNLKIGDIIKYGQEAEKKTGHCLFFTKIPIGCYVFNFSTTRKAKPKIAKSAGTYGVLTKKTKNHAEILLASGHKKLISLNAFANIGIASNELTFLSQLGKAGKNRWLNVRPTVRGVAKNPIDHPNGGGEGKKSGKRKTPWGKIMNSKK